MIKKFLSGNIKGAIAIIVFLAALQMIPSIPGLFERGSQELERTLKKAGATLSLPAGRDAGQTPQLFGDILNQRFQPKEHGNSDFPDFYIVPQRLKVQAEQEDQEEPFSDFYVWR